MKKLRYTGLLMVIALLLTSCGRDNAVPQEEGVDVTILIAANGAGTRTGTHEGTGIDSDIEHFRVLIFNSKTGVLAYMAAFTPPDTPEKIEMKTGVYDFVMIANDDMDNTLNGLLEGLDTTGTSTFNGIKDYAFASSAFDSGKCIPMLSVVRGVTVLPGGEVVLPGKADQNEGSWDETNHWWNVELERLATRLDVQITLSSTQTANSTDLTISNVPNKVYLFPGKHNDDGYEAVSRKAENPTIDGRKMTWSRIILPESIFPDITNEDKGIKISLTVDDTPRSAVVGVNPGTDYRMPRNTYLSLSGTIPAPTIKDIQFNVTVVDWDNADMVPGTELY